MGLVHVVLTTIDACFARGFHNSVAMPPREMSRQMCAVRGEVTQIGRSSRTSAREPVKFARDGDLELLSTKSKRVLQCFRFPRVSLVGP